MALARGGLIRLPWRGGEAKGTIPVAELLAALPTPLLVVDAAGLIAEANVAAETLFNVSRSGVIGRTLAELTGEALAGIHSDQPFAAYDIDIVLPGGGRHRVDLNAAPIADRSGWQIVTIHGRIPAHLAGRRGDRHGGTLTAIGAAAMLAHEIKNPLSGIRGAAQLLEAGGDEAHAALTKLIRDEVDRVTALIDRMEGFTDTRPLERQPQNIHAILGHVRDVAARGFAQGIAIREIYDPSLPAVLGHRDALVQIFLNLLKNAAEAMADTVASPAITLTTAYRHGVLVTTRGTGRRSLPIEVCVIDEGPGAPAELAEHLFDPFVTSKRSGGGLGLALVDKLVADQGGIVEYAREGAPPRTVLRVLLPRVREG